MLRSDAQSVRVMGCNAKIKSKPHNDDDEHCTVQDIVVNEVSVHSKMVLVPSQTYDNECTQVSNHHIAGNTIRTSHDGLGHRSKSTNRRP